MAHRPLSAIFARNFVPPHRVDFTRSIGLDQFDYRSIYTRYRGRLPEGIWVPTTHGDLAYNLDNLISQSHDRPGTLLPWATPSTVQRGVG